MLDCPFETAEGSLSQDILLKDGGGALWVVI